MLGEDACFDFAREVFLKFEFSIMFLGDNCIISDGDLITLGDDSDLLLGLQSGPNLSLQVHVENEALLQITEILEQVNQLQVR